MFKKICFIIFSVALFVGCSDKDDSLLEPDHEPETESGSDQEVQPLPIGLVADIYEQNIYGMVVFSLQDSIYEGPNEEVGIMLQYIDALDSLSWEVEGNEKKASLLEKESSGSTNFSVKWGHYFYLPGS